MQDEQRARKDAPDVPRDAGVTFVMPVLNERDYLRRAVETVLAQDVDGPSELILALAPSTDGTTELAREIAAGDERVVLVDNPAADIPVETRIMTISDIFDALTASDRPYKKAVPIDRALGIIESEVKAGKCDPDLFKVFVEAEVYKKVL